jgi:hypothetical protein
MALSDRRKPQNFGYGNIGLSQSDAHGFIMEPRELEGAINESGMDQDWIIGSFAQPHLDFFW